MTRDETKTILATMTAVYPKNLLPDISELTVNVWFQLLQDVPYRTASAAVMAWMQTNKYPPTPANIREYTAPDRSESAESAWGRLQQAVRKYGHTEKQQAALAIPDIWPLVDRWGWDHWCQMPIEDAATYYAQFRNAYESDRRRSTERARLSPSVVAALDGLKRLEDGK